MLGFWYISITIITNLQPTHLRQSLASLRKGMRSCRHRQAYLQLAAQQYNLALHPVDLADFASELTSGRHVTLDIPRVTVLLDPTLCGLILDNALSNAFKHGHPDHPSVKLTITWSAHEDDRVGLLVKVSSMGKQGQGYTCYSLFEFITATAGCYFFSCALQAWPFV